MIKKFLICMFAALAVSGIISVNAVADEAEDTTIENTVDDKSNDRIKITDDGKIILTADNAADNKVDTLHLKLKVAPEEENTPFEVSFEINESFKEKVNLVAHRYDSDTKELNIYVCATEALFESSTIEIGSVYTRNTEGETVAVAVTADEKSFEYVSQNQLTISENFESFESVVTSSGKMVGINSANKSSNIHLKKVVPSSYTVIIPTDKINVDKPSEMSVSAKNVMISHNEVLDISVNSANNWYLVNGNSGTAQLKYQIKLKDGTIISDAQKKSLISVNAGSLVNGTVEKTLTAEVAGTPEYSGMYTDTLTFTVAVNEQQ